MRPGLQRRGSSGSLTERTFRDPPPQRSASAQATYVPLPEAPPVPALPQKYASPASASEKAAKRAASVEPPERISSPPRAAGGRLVSLERGSGVMKPPPGGLKAKTAGLNHVSEPDRPGSRNSVNFSRPMSPQNSPPISPLAGGRVRSPPPNSASAAESLNGEPGKTLHSKQETASAPIKKKKKKVAQAPAEGTHLAAGTVNGLPQSSSQVTPQQQAALAATAPSSPSTASSASTKNDAPKAKKKKKKVVLTAAPPTPDPSEGYGSAYQSDTDSVVSEQSSSNERPRSYNTRAAGLLMKQPSIVREDREAEEEAESPTTGKKANGQVAQGGISEPATPANTSKIVSHKKTASQPDASKRTSLDVPSAGRPLSLSPSRSAHFLSKPEYDTSGVRHQPPGRSVSPAKSALKHSPSRGSSPALVAARLAPSEASDTASNVSDDVSKPVTKKKKSVRVSFDEDSVAIGRAATPPLTPDTPQILSPQNKPKGRSWFDLVRENKQDSPVIDSDDTVIKPTPTLPSFGSVRGRPEERANSSEGDSTPNTDWAQDTLRRLDASSTDQVVGAALAQESAKRGKQAEARPAVQQKRGPYDPIPPEVTSVEGSGYHSDEEANLFEEHQEKLATTSSEVPVEGVTEPTQDSKIFEANAVVAQSEEPEGAVPSIALQPATPALESTSSNRDSWFGMPGGFPRPTATTESTDSDQVTAINTHEHHSPEVTPATVGLAEPEPEAAAAQHDPSTAHVGEVAQNLRAQIESQGGGESEDGSSIYSDAAEDPDDLDGDGFGSINAIVESPASPMFPQSARSPPTSPSVKATAATASEKRTGAKKGKELTEPDSEEGWDKAQSYWAGLSHAKKQQLEMAALPGAADERAIPHKTMRGPDSVKRKKKKVPRKSSPPLDSLASASTSQSKPTAPRAASPPVAPLKSALRNSQLLSPHEPQMRTSMRDGPPPKSSLRNASQPTPQPKGALQKKSRPMSAVAMVDYNKPGPAAPHGHTRAVSAGNPARSVTPLAAPPRKKPPPAKGMLFRNDSDSDSSFKKSRPTTPSTNRYSMRRSMRPQSTDTQPQSRVINAPQRMSSPASSITRRPAAPGEVRMRTSMRESKDFNKPAARTSLRDSIDSKRAKSPSRFFGKSKSKVVETTPMPRFSSRLNDSSDEDDVRPIPSSRLADSSDDEPSELTPVRGIPRRIDEGESTDLEDSSAEERRTGVPAPSKAKANNAKAPAAPQGSALASGSLRSASGENATANMGSGLAAKKAAEKDKKKRSFFGSLSSKRKTDDPTRVRKSSLESAARRDTPLERSRAERTGTSPTKLDERVLAPSSAAADPVAQSPRPAIGSRTSTAQSSPKAPKLQRRTTPKGAITKADVSWPLPPQVPDGGTDSTPNSRPRTSDGQATSGRPEIGRRFQSDIGTSALGPAPLVGGGGKKEKKKRFGMLRKAFGLHD